MRVIQYLDPFMGSGTTYKITYIMNRKPIGIEINPKYIDIANRRLSHYLNQTKLFGGDLDPRSSS